MTTDEKWGRVNNVLTAAGWTCLDNGGFCFALLDTPEETDGPGWTAGFNSDGPDDTVTPVYLHRWANVQDDAEYLEEHVFSWRGVGTGEEMARLILAAVNARTGN